jgi:hypothetical protein
MSDQIENLPTIELPPVAAPIVGLPTSAFISNVLIERRVELGDGTASILHFKDPGHAIFTRFLQERASEDEETRMHCASKLIAASLCNPDGSQAIGFTTAKTLVTPVANAIVEVIFEICGVGRKKA